MSIWVAIGLAGGLAGAMLLLVWWLMAKSDMFPED
jgi:hypothetical protein